MKTEILNLQLSPSDADLIGDCVKLLRQIGMQLQPRDKILLTSRIHEQDQGRLTPEQSVTANLLAVAALVSLTPRDLEYLPEEERMRVQASVNFDGADLGVN